MCFTIRRACLPCILHVINPRTPGNFAARGVITYLILKSTAPNEVRVLLQYTRLTSIKRNDRAPNNMSLFQSLAVIQAAALLYSSMCVI